MKFGQCTAVFTMIISPIAIIIANPWRLDRMHPFDRFWMHNNLAQMSHPRGPHQTFDIINIFVFIFVIFVILDKLVICKSQFFRCEKKVKERPKRRAENGLNNAGRQQWDFCGQPLHQGHGGLAGPKVWQDVATGQGHSLKCIQDESVADANDIYDGSLQKNLAVRWWLW